MSSARDSITGFDPYDALRGRRVPNLVRRHPRMRQAALQLRKRFPVNIAPLLGVDPFAMAKSAGCQLSACARNAAAGDENAKAVGREVLDLLLGAADIARSQTGGYGYEFDVQTRWSYYPADTPNVIATYFVGRGLLEYSLACGDSASTDAARRAAAFVADELISARGHVCYTPLSDTLVHNANALGAGLMASCGRLHGDEALIQGAHEAVRVTVSALSAIDVWPYGEDERLSWVDNFHTAYTLDGLVLVWLATEDGQIRSVLERAAARWESAFFGDDGSPFYYADGSGPLDVHSGATAVDVACRLADLDLVSPGLAPRVAGWMRKHLVAEDDLTTFYRLHAGWTDKRHFTRWGDAHWALARASLSLSEASCAPILESALLGG